MTRTITSFIDGAFVPADGARLFDKRSPVDGRVIAHIAEADAAQVDAAVQAARRAMAGEWGRMTTEKRCALLHAVADEITRRFDDFVAAEMADTGQPQHVMTHVFIPRGAANFKVFADVVKNVAAESFRMDTPDGRGALNYAIRRPKGVIGVVCPWNAPFLLMTWKLGPALACGNAVVVKPSEETPLTAALLGEVYSYDLFPTLCELAGFSAPAGLDSRSLVPAFDTGAAPIRDTVGAAYMDAQRMVSDGRWKLVVYRVRGSERVQLFDLQEDPDECVDLAANPAHAPRMEELWVKLRAWQADARDRWLQETAAGEPTHCSTR